MRSRYPMGSAVTNVGRRLCLIREKKLWSAVVLLSERHVATSRAGPRLGRGVCGEGALGVAADGRRAAWERVDLADRGTHPVGLGRCETATLKCNPGISQKNLELIVRSNSEVLECIRDGSTKLVGKSLVLSTMSNAASPVLPAGRNTLPVETPFGAEAVRLVPLSAPNMTPVAVSVTAVNEPTATA
jgi:hypothetical protein